MINAPHRSQKTSRTLRVGLIAIAGALALVILVLDLETRVGYGIGALYLIPLLISALSGPPRTAFLAAWIASLLVVADLLKLPWSEIPQVAVANRSIALVVIWTTAAVVIRFRETSLQLEERTRDLADVNYAIDQSAIVALTDQRGKITFANDKFCEISKYSRDELLGQDHRLVNSGYHSKEFIKNLWDTISAGRIWRGEIRNRAKDGSIYWVDTTIVPFLDESNRPYQYMAIRYDITDRKRTEELMREQAALTRLGQMAAVVAHEVKNPLAGIRGALQVIRSRMPADQRDRTIIAEIIARLDALNAIVGDLLLFARPRQLHPEPIDVAALIKSTADLLRRDPALAATTVRVEGGGTIIQADREMLHIVVQNILMNAAQAMGGRGEIAARIATSNGTCQIAFVDRGPGMPAEVREKAFEAFFTTKHRGTGLGLPIARRLIESHGGAIDIETPPEGGTVVRVDLPVL